MVVRDEDKYFYHQRQVQDHDWSRYLDCGYLECTAYPQDRDYIFVPKHLFFNTKDPLERFNKRKERRIEELSISADLNV